MLKISPACLAAGAGLPASVACRNLLVGGRVAAGASVPWADAAAPDVGCEFQVNFLFGAKGVSVGLGSSWSSSGLPDGEKMTVSWDAGMDSGISTMCFVGGWSLVGLPLLLSGRSALGLFSRVLLFPPLFFGWGCSLHCSLAGGRACLAWCVGLQALYGMLCFGQLNFQLRDAVG